MKWIFWKNQNKLTRTFLWLERSLFLLTLIEVLFLRAQMETSSTACISPTNQPSTILSSRTTQYRWVSQPLKYSQETKQTYKWLIYGLTILTLPKYLSLQFRPAYHPEGLYDDAKSSIGSNNAGQKPMIQTWHGNGTCLEGTVPIRRTKKDDLLRASSMRRYGRKRHTVPNPLSVDPNMLSEGGHQVRPHCLSCWDWRAWLHWHVVITELLPLWNSARDSVCRRW